MGFTDKLQHAWNSFLNRDPTDYYQNYDYGNVSYIRPDRVRFSGGNERSIVTSVYNRIALDTAAISIILLEKTTTIGSREQSTLD